MSRMPFTHRVLNTLLPTRAPDRIIGDLDDPYMCRWWLIPRNRFLNVYLHQFMRSDDDRALHDHPWMNASWLLKGSYNEILPIGKRGGSLYQFSCQRQITYMIERREGEFAFRMPTQAHRVTLKKGSDGREIPVWTLFVTGPIVRQWGFWCLSGWRHWKVFTAFDQDGHGGRVGRGCD